MCVQMKKFRTFDDDTNTVGDKEGRSKQLRELHKFQRGEEMQRLMLGVSKTLGLNYTLSLRKYTIQSVLLLGPGFVCETKSAKCASSYFKNTRNAQISIAKHYTVRFIV